MSQNAGALDVSFEGPPGVKVLEGLTDSQESAALKGQDKSARRDVRLTGVQYLRGIAALMVVYFHAVPPTSFLRIHAPIDVSRLRNGVDIFFVISGLIMVVTVGRSTPLQFLGRRIVRIVPLYWILTICLVALIVAAPAVVPHWHDVSWPSIAKSLLFIPYPNPDRYRMILPILLPGWTLSLEMYFYLIFALTLVPFLRARQVLVASAIFVGLAIANGWAGPPDSLAWFYTQPRILEFLSGLLLGHLYVNGRYRLTRPLAIGLLLAGFVLLICPLPWSASHWSFWVGQEIPAVMIVAAAVGLETSGPIPRWRFLEWLGDASYSIYLSHTFAMIFIVAIWSAAGFGHGRVAAAGLVVAILAATLVCAAACYWLIEKPLLKLVKRARAGSRRVSVAGVSAPV